MSNNTYVWSITELNCLPTAGSLTDYVVTSHWLCTGTDGTYNGGQKGIAVFTVDPTKKDYTPYQDLKEDEVIRWTQDALGADTVQLIYRTIDRQIQGQVTPAIISPPLPWESS